MNDLTQVVEEAKTSFVQAKDRLVHGLATTPDDRINWSPAPSARTPIQLVAHAANSVKHIHNMLDGRVFPIPTTAEAETFHRDSEKPYTTREAVLELLETNGSAYLEWLDGMTQAQLESTVEMPFKLGFAPVPVGIAAQAQHMNWHAAQIDYIQTIYGDQDWHIGV